MHKNSALLFAVLLQALSISLFSHSGFGQTDRKSCVELMNGTFHNYPRNSSIYMKSTLDGKYYHITEYPSGDTSVWEIQTAGKCAFSLKYLKGSAKLNAQRKEFLASHSIRFEINDINAEYFTLTSYLDKSDLILEEADTMWYLPKASIPDSRLFERITNPSTLKKNHFRDTSQYAVVYLYRPGKFVGNLANYNVYLDNFLLAEMKNNSGYIFKILKEGRHEFRSKYNKVESKFKLDIKFGEKYYLKSTIHLTLSNLQGSKLEMDSAEAEKGEAEFQEADFQTGN